MGSLKKMMLAAGLALGATGVSAATSAAEAHDNVRFAVRVSDGYGTSVVIGAGGVYLYERGGWYYDRHGRRYYCDGRRYHRGDRYYRRGAYYYYDDDYYRRHRRHEWRERHHHHRGHDDDWRR
ncbi:MAG: hypothetical protein GC153_07300 [Alphaproteobacteria bacterium]|nr:hypothetical protein [Alphaproteobacteria bacterium]